MDLSKLPKLSQTAKPSTDAAEPSPIAESRSEPAGGAFCPTCGSPLRAGARFCDSCGAQMGRAPMPRSGADAWISIAIGVILLFLFPHLIVYLLHPGTTQFDAIDAQTGASIPYAHSAFIWPDIGVTFFCLMLIVDALLMLLIPKRGVAILGLVLAAACAALNLFVVIRSMNIIGFQVICAIAIAFSIYIAIQRWSIIRSK
jgi:hypothetical protein